MKKRDYTLLDKFLGQVNDGLQTIFGDYQSARANPAKEQKKVRLSLDEKKSSAGMMRVNHSGEVCAQALYQGQMTVARNKDTYAVLEKACAEETDHLAWTHERLQDFNSHRSYLNIFWYMSSYMIGMVAGTLGDKWSLGFVEETERQVTKHLQGHLDSISAKDKKSRAILELMKEDEIHHGQSAAKAGGAELPVPIKILMQLQSKVLTTLAYYI